MSKDNPKNPSYFCPFNWLQNFDKSSSITLPYKSFPLNEGILNFLTNPNLHLPSKLSASGQNDDNSSDTESWCSDDKSLPFLPRPPHDDDDDDDTSDSDDVNDVNDSPETREELKRVKKQVYVFRALLNTLISELDGAVIPKVNCVVPKVSAVLIIRDGICMYG
jgi:hypothetical protein